jgi:CBS-domain-containing membrane protein
MVITDEHMTRVFAKLVSEGFLSAPVLDEHRRFIGFVDMLDIMTYTVSLFEKEQLDWNQSNWEGFWARLATFRGARVKDVMSIS